jgi:hypothetical protein
VYDYTAGSNVANIVVDHTFASPKLGNSATFIPTQAAVVASNLTGLSGRHNRGRSYLPATGAGMLTGHSLSTTDTDNVASAHRSLISNISAITYGSATTLGCVVLRNLATPANITSVKVDNEVDIQRRRADKIAATYSKTIAV